MPKGTVDSVNQVAGLFDTYVEVAVHRPFGTIVIVDEVIAYRRYKLVSGNHFDQLWELSRLVQQAVRLSFHPHQRERERRESMRYIRRVGRMDKIGQRSRHFVHAISAGYVLILIAHHIACIAFWVVIPHPMKVREHQRGIEPQLVGVGFLRITRMAVSQRPVVGAVTLKCERLTVAEQVFDSRFERQVRTKTVVGTVSHTGIRCQTIHPPQAITAVGLMATPLVGCAHA